MKLDNVVKILDINHYNEKIKNLPHTKGLRDTQFDSLTFIIALST